MMNTAEGKKNNMGFRSGYVSLVGRPNVGKSSLINALLHEKVAAVSSKPQTTRNAVRCIMTTDAGQIVFVDTPGLHQPKHELGRFMMKEAEDAMDSVDVICFVADAQKGEDAASEAILESLRGRKQPIVFVINKIDRLKGKRGEAAFWGLVERLSAIVAPKAVVPVSALEGTNLDVLQQELIKLLPEGDLIYPEDVLMDTTERFLAEEIIREKIFEATEQEVPHSVAVMIESFKTPDEYPELSVAEIRADIVVERQGQKGIIVGARGEKLKEIGTAARLEMEDRFGYKVFLQLWVKVRPDWRKTSTGISRMGYRSS